MSAGTALATAPTLDVIVDSKLFGSLTVSEDELFQFPNGLYGFPECRTFVMLAAERDGFYWLQSADHSALAFMLVDPFLFFDGYTVELGNTDRAELEIDEPSDAAILAIVTLPRGPGEPPTANLQGPLALNTRDKRGKQIALQDTEFGVRCELDLEKHA